MDSDFTNLKLQRMKTKEDILNNSRSKNNCLLYDENYWNSALDAMEQYAQQQVKALAINDVRLTLILEALEKALIKIKGDVDWSFTDCETWAKRQHEVSAKIELIKELLNNEA